MSVGGWTRTLGQPAGRVAVAASESTVSRVRVLAPWLLVTAAVVWNLLSLRPEMLGVSYLDDSSIHEQMVRFATAQFHSGHLPLTSWFPYLGLGSPQFLHYQSLPAMLTGLIGLTGNPDAAFRWTMYLLLSIWPVSVYFSARLFGAGRPAAAASAAMSPFLMSVVGIGYEQRAYIWSGYGVWTQLWASLTLPLAWGLSWRAIRTGRQFLPAVALVSLTIALHFQTAYLAVIPLLAWPLVAGAPVAARLRRAGLLLAGALLASAWVIVPVIAQRNWAATNEVLHGSALANGYGAGRVIAWLVSGQLLDAGRIPVITVFAGIGLGVACARARRDASSRALLVALALCLILSFGRTTFGGLVDLIPGSGDLFFRRFMMGVQLASVLLAGIGAAWSGRTIWSLSSRGWPGRLLQPNRTAPAVFAMAAMTVVLAPAWLQLRSLDNRSATTIEAQRTADAIQGGQVDRLVAVIRQGGGGRVYAGMPSNWGMSFTVGAVPVFKYLESRDVDEVGYTLRTASLMTDPEYFFDERAPGDYQLFGIHYLILPPWRAPPVPAHLVMRAGPYSLWTTGVRGYVHLGTVVGTLAADRTTVGARSVALLHSNLAQRQAFLRVSYRASRAAGSLPVARAGPPTGSVTGETDNLRGGLVSARVAMRRPGVAVLSASFDPGWRLTIDGHAARTVMIAPAVVGAAVGPGSHTLVFRYEGFGDYLALFGLSAASLALLLALDVVLRRRALTRRR